MRRILRAPKYVALAGVRSELGISSMRDRVARGRIQYVRAVMQGDNELLKKVMEYSQRNTRSGWWKATRRDLRWTGIQEEEIQILSKQEMGCRWGGGE